MLSENHGGELEHTNCSYAKETSRGRRRNDINVGEEKCGVRVESSRRFDLDLIISLTCLILS